MASPALTVAPRSPVAARVVGELAAAFRRPLIASLALALVYMIGVSQLDPDGVLGGDTGNRVATLQAMQDHPASADVGYWAEAHDPDGNLHPLLVGRTEAGRWVGVGTVVGPLAAQPPYRLGGYPATLLLTIAGAVAAALAARRLARRLASDVAGTGEREGWLAFWTIALASPLAIYALDLYDHAPGLALMAWGTIWMLEAADRGRARQAIVGRAAAAGAALGLAATMRTEALVYAAAATVVAGLTIMWRHDADRRRDRFVRAALAGVVFVVVMAGFQLANLRLEEETLGGALRATRTSGAARGVDDISLGARVDLAFLNAAAMRPQYGSHARIESALLLAGSAVAGLGVCRRSRRLAVAATVVACVALVARLRQPVEFVPGMLAAAPFVPAGLVITARHRNARPMLAIAAVGFVGVVATQWAELNPTQFQWGGRYVMLSGFLLAVVGVVGLARLGRWATILGVAAALGVSAHGIDLLRTRSHVSGDLARALPARSEDVLIDRAGLVFRDAGAGYSPERRWLRGRNDAEALEAFGVAEAVGALTVGLLETADSDGGRLGSAVEGWCPGEVDHLRWDAGRPLTVTTWTRCD